LTLTIFADGVENPANLARLDDVARLLGITCSQEVDGRLIAVENSVNARPIYGRRPLRERATLALGNERRGLSVRTLERADETLVIPTESRTVRTLNVAAAAAVAGWYVLRGSGPQAHARRPEVRRPALLIVGSDHVEVGSSLRSAAAFGFRDVLLDDRGAGWFEGSAATRREARAAARRHKNPLRVHRATLADVERFDDVLVVLEFGEQIPLQSKRLAGGRRQLVVVGLGADDVDNLPAASIEVASLKLAAAVRAPLRFVASIALAEIARQVGRRRREPPGVRIPSPKYEAAVKLQTPEDVLLVDPSRLLSY
jgi:tRNA(Leu) C34 or U34 (ribose-2'-O)-methylase TrmL